MEVRWAVRPHEPLKAKDAGCRARALIIEEGSRRLNQKKQTSQRFRTMRLGLKLRDLGSVSPLLRRLGFPRNLFRRTKKHV